MATANLGPDGPSSRGHTTAQGARRRAESSARTPGDESRRLCAAGALEFLENA